MFGSASGGTKRLGHFTSSNHCPRRQPERFSASSYASWPNWTDSRYQSISSCTRKAHGVALSGSCRRGGYDNTPLNDDVSPSAGDYGLDFCLLRLRHRELVKCLLEIV